MANFSLNIYGKNDEIVNTFYTDHVRWGLLVRALDLQEQLKDATAAEQLEAVSALVLDLLPGITEEDLRNADGRDVLNLFTQVGKMAKTIKGKNA